jgi:hypothetical protein
VPGLRDADRWVLPDRERRRRGQHLRGPSPVLSRRFNSAPAMVVGRCTSSPRRWPRRTTRSRPWRCCTCMHTPDPIGFFTHHPDKTTYQKMLNGAYNRGEWWDGMKAAFDGCKTTDVLGCFARSSNGAIAVDHAAAIVGLHAGAGRGHPVRCAGVGDRPRSLLGQPTRSHRCRPSTRSPPAPASCSCPCIPPAPDRARAAGLSGRSRSRRAGLAGPARRP